MTTCNFQINGREHVQILSDSGRVQNTISGEDATIFCHLLNLRSTEEDRQAFLAAWAHAQTKNFFDFSA